MRRALVLATVLAAVMAAPAQAATVTVSMKGLTFQPAVARAAIGDTVTWSNAASDRHSTTSAGPTPWDSARLSPFSGHFSRVFPIAGSFPYYCTIHRSTGMTGVVKVATKVAPGSGTTATDFVVTLAKVGQQPPTGYVYMVQKAVGSGAFTNVIRTTAATAHLRLTTRGTYKLRAGLQKSSGALNTAWFSDPVTVTVS